MPMFVAMSEGTIKGFFAMGQNPAVGGQNAGFQRQALAKLDWLVVRDLYETETASFLEGLRRRSRAAQLTAADIKTEVFFLPAAAVPEMDGSFTNTQRLVQWHDKAVDPPGRRPLRHLVHRPPRPAAQGALRRQHDATRPADPRADLGLHRRSGKRRVAHQGRAVGGAHPQGDQRF